MVCVGGAVIVCLRCLGMLSSPSLTPIVSHGVSVGSLGRGAVCAVEGMTQSLVVGLEGPRGLQTHSEVPALRGKWHVVPLTDCFIPTLKQPEPDCSHLRQPHHPDPRCPCGL